MLTAAVAAAAGFIALTFLIVPHALPLLRAALHGGAALVRSIAPIGTLGAALVQIGSVLTRPLLSLGESFGAVQPLVWTVLIAGACAAIAASLVIVGRAFLREEPAFSRKEF